MSPWLRAGLVGLLALLLGLWATRVTLSSDLAEALPHGGEIGRAMRDIDRFAVLATVLVEVDGTGRPESELHAAVDALGARLAARPELAVVRYRFGLEEGAKIAAVAGPHAGALSDPELLAERLSPEGMRRALERSRDLLFSPAGALAARQLELDPLGLADTFTRGLSAGVGPQGAALRQGHLLSADGQHALIVARARTPALGTSLDSPLVRGLEEDLAASPLPADWIGPHRFAAEAQAMIRREVHRAVGAGTTLVAAVFLVAFRSLRPVLGALPAVLLGGVAAGAAAAARSPIHGLSLAFGGALGGMGVDYWIHLYLTGLRGGVPATFRERLAAGEAAVRHLLPAYAISVGATLLAFLLLATSSYAAVSDLAWIGVGAVLGAFASAVLAGPVAFALVARPGDRVPRLPVPDRVPGWMSAALLLGLVVLAFGATRLRFDGDPRSLDARDPETAALERAVLERYGGGSAGLVVAEGPNLGDALERLSAATEALEHAPGVSLRSPLQLLPPPSRVAEARALLSQPDLEARFLEAAAAVGFEGESLLPGLRAALAATEAPSPATWADTPLYDLIEQTVDLAGGEVAVAALVSSETDIGLAHAQGLVEERGAEARFLVPVGVAREGAARIKRELLTRSGLGILVILVFMVLRYRDAPRVLAATLPSLAAAAGTFGLLALVGVPLTPVSGPAFVLVLGMAFDQGIFLVEADRADQDTWLASRAAIFIALAAALAGFAGLMAASHPAVFGVGIVVSLGITFTALAVFLVLPGLVGARGQEATRRWGRRLALAGVVALCLDALVAAAGRLAPPPAPATDPAWTLDERGPTERAFGPNRMARVHGLWAMYVEGTAHEIGVARAVLSQPVDRRNEVALAQEFDKHVPNLLARYLLVRGVPLLASRMAASIDPAHLEELAAFSHSLGPDPLAWVQPSFTRRLCYHAIHDLGQAMVDSPLVACTGFAAGGARTTDGHWLLARAFDFDGGRYFDEDKAVIAVRRQGAIPFVHVAIPGLAGAVSGLNAEGLAVAVHASASDDPIRPATPMIFLVREVLERARTIDEARAILDRGKGFVSENVLVVDGARGQAAVLEVTPATVELLPATDAIAVSNHFRTPALLDHAANRLRMAEGTSVARLARMNELLSPAHGPIDLARAATLLRDRSAPGGAPHGAPLPRGHESAINADIASHGVIIDATARTITVSTWPNLSGGFVRFHLDDLLSGDLSGDLVIPPDDPAATLRVHEARQLVRDAHDQPPTRAEATLRRALALNPGDVLALTALGRVLIDLDRQAEAIDVLEQALATPPARAREVREAEELLVEARK